MLDRIDFGPHRGHRIIFDRMMLTACFSTAST
jgi:hypothetical protein